MVRGVVIVAHASVVGRWWIVWQWVLVAEASITPLLPNSQATPDHEATKASP